MSNRLAARHKCSLTLKSPMKKSSLKKFVDDERKNKFSIFPWIICLVFFIHWIIVCPLIWALLYRTVFTENWPNFWHWLYWLVALVIWLLTMLVLTLIWRKMRNSESLTTMKINSDPGPYYSTNVESVQPDVFKVRSTTRDNDTDSRNDRPKICEEESARERRKKLAPLIIHRNISGMGEIENSGEVKIENFDDSRIDTPKKRESGLGIDMDKYLRIVDSATPETSSPGEQNDQDVPLSPRELFFIDLIRQAEKSEDCAVEKSKDEFFGSDEIAERKEKIEESSYFIANVGSPMRAKNEIFIEIEQSKNEDSMSIDEDMLKPRLTLITVAKECDNEEKSSEKND